jgi:hypothetical protein
MRRIGAVHSEYFLPGGFPADNGYAPADKRAAQQNIARFLLQSGKLLHIFRLAPSTGR